MSMTEASYAKTQADVFPSECRHSKGKRPVKVSAWYHVGKYFREDLGLTATEQIVLLELLWRSGPDLQDRVRVASIHEQNSISRSQVYKTFQKLVKSGVITPCNAKGVPTDTKILRQTGEMRLKWLTYDGIRQKLTGRR